MYEMATNIRTSNTLSDVGSTSVWQARMRKARVALRHFAREVVNLGAKHESEVERDLAEKISRLNLVTLQNRRHVSVLSDK